MVVISKEQFTPPREAKSDFPVVEPAALQMYRLRPQSYNVNIPCSERVYDAPSTNFCTFPSWSPVL